MTQRRAVWVRWGGFIAVVLWCSTLLAGVSQVWAATTTWRVTSASDDANDGNIADQSGSLRFVLAHAVAGDQVLFQIDAETLVVGSTLTVPPGVAVGSGRDQPCRSYSTPIINLQATTNTIKPIISLGAGATLRNVAIGGGDVSVWITGSDVDMCGVALGQIYDGDGYVLTQPPLHAALIIDGDHAVVHRNYINGAVSVTPHGSDSRIGDTIGGSGEANAGVRDAAVTVLADANGAAQRVTIRDPFPRALHAMVGSGVAGGDDDPTHANNWALTPTLISAQTSDDYASVQVNGIASPHALVDIYFDIQTDVVRQPPVVADATGFFSFNGPLPNKFTTVIAASVLNDPAYPTRVGSSSKWSNELTVGIASPNTGLMLMPDALTFTALAGGPQPPAQYLAVATPTLSPTLDWHTSITTTDGGAWLAAAPAFGASSGLITVTVDPAALTPGTFHGTVAITSPSDSSLSATAAITLVLQSNEPLLAAVGAVGNTSDPMNGPANIGDILHCTVTMSNVGAVDVTDIASNLFTLSRAVHVITGTGAIAGDGIGFTANDISFAKGAISPGLTATYSFDVEVIGTLRPGAVVFSMEVTANGIVAIPVVGRNPLGTNLGVNGRYKAFLPFAQRGSS